MIKPRQKAMSNMWYETTFDGKATALEVWGVWETFSLPLLPVPLWLGVIVLDRFSLMGQVDMFKNYSYSIVWFGIVTLFNGKLNFLGLFNTKAISIPECVNVWVYGICLSKNVDMYVYVWALVLL